MRCLLCCMFCITFVQLNAQISDDATIQVSGVNNVLPQIGFPIPTVTTEDLFNSTQLEYKNSKLISLNDSSGNYECFKSLPRFFRIPRGCIKPALESKDKDFIAFFHNLRTPKLALSPSMFDKEDREVVANNAATYPYISSIRRDLAISLDKELDEISIDEIEQYVEYKSSKYKIIFNADIVITYPISLGGEFLRERYNHCDVLLLYKKEIGHFSLYCFYTDKGYKQRKKYNNELEKMLKFKE